MKIVLYPYNFHGGTAIYIVELVKYFKSIKEKKEIYVIGEKEGKEGNITFIKQPTISFKKLYIYTPLGHLFRPFVNYKLSSIINDINPDLVISSGFLYFIKKKIPILQVGWDYPRSILDAVLLAKRYASGFFFFYRAIREVEGTISDRLFPTRNNLTVCVSKIVTKKLKERGENAIYLPPGINFVDSKLEKYDKFTICFVGKNHIWTKRKGLKYLLDALLVVNKKYPELDYGVKIIGRYPFYSNSKFKKYKKIKDKIKIMGLLSRDETLKTVAKSHILAAPSLYDEFGYAILESLMYGTPVIGSNNESFKDMLEGGCGIITDIKNPVIFAKDIIRLIKDKELLNNMGIKAREKVKRDYSWDRIMSRIMKEIKI